MPRGYTGGCMRWFAVPFIALFTANIATAQVDDAAAGASVGIPVGTPIPVAPIAPVPYGLSNSVIDHNGRLLVFDVTYQYPSPLPGQPGQPVDFRFPPTRTTRVTIIESDASRKRDAQYPGAFQVVGVGRYAVYALVTDYIVGTMFAQAPISIARRLVALSSSFPTLPSLDVPLQADVKVSAVGDDGTPDTIALVDITPSPLIFDPTKETVIPAAIPTRQRTVQ